MSYWGYHLILDCAGLNPDTIRNEKNIYNFIVCYRFTGYSPEG